MRLTISRSVCVSATKILNFTAEDNAVLLFSVETYKQFLNCILIFYYLPASCIRFWLSVFTAMFEWLLNLSIGNHKTTVGMSYVASSFVCDLPTQCCCSYSVTST